MPENKNHNDPLDKLFQKKAKEYDIAFREEDWDQMKQKLDLKDAHIAYRKKLVWMAAASALIIIMLGYFTFDNYSRLNELAEQQGPPTESEITEPPMISGIPDTSVDRESVKDEDDSSKMEEPIADHEVSNIKETTIASAQTNLHIERFEDAQQISGITDRKIRGANFETGINKPTSISKGIHTHHHETFMSTVGTEPTDFETEKGFMSRLSVGLAMSPDLSTVGSISDFYDPGYKAGINLEYSITENLSVSVGVIHSLVKYTAQSNNYNPSYYWTGGNAPDEIIGECLLFDIPISLKFNFLNFERSRFFATAGLSSYFMQSEEYSFNYRAYQPGQEEGWSGQTGTSHWLSNAGFSIGYEFDIHPDWSMRVEPFIKVPVQEVGWGNVELYSMGSFISLSYRL
ncbi:MAG: hypothetical protein ACQETF_00775 [Bacteroidota bacterium]